MIQFFIVIIAVILSAVYLFLRIRNKGADCDPSQCPGCSYYDNCSKDEKKNFNK